MQKPGFTYMPKAHEHIRKQQCRNAYIPSNIIKNEKGYEILLAVPGIEKNSIQIELKENILIIESKSKQEKDQKMYSLKQFDYSNFSKKYELNDSIDRDSIEAIYKKGILSISLSLKDKEEASIVKKIDIK